MPDLSISRALADLTVWIDTARAFSEVCAANFHSVLSWYEYEGRVFVSDMQGHGWTWLAWAPTLEEVWALLPESIIVDGETYWINHDRVTHERVFYADVIQRVLMLPNGHNAMEEHISPVEAAAALYLALVRAGHIGDATSPQTTP